MASSPVFGIDLGTTNTVVACCMDGGLPDVVSMRSNHSNPSVVSFDGDSFQVGNQANRTADPSSSRQIIRMVKRIIGLPLSQFDKTSPSHSMLMYDVVQDKESKVVDNESHKKTASTKMCAVRVNYKGKDRVYRPEILSGLLLAFINQELSEMYNLENKALDVVISVPAYFNTVQRRATEAAGKMAGFRVLRVVNEPTAGAFAYALHHDASQERNVLVYDFGGGTFDCTALQRQRCEGNDTRMVVLATKGNHILGGEDIDDQIMKLILREGAKAITERNERLNSQIITEKALKSQSLMEKTLRKACEVKEKMTGHTLQSVKVKVPFSEETEFEDVTFDFSFSQLQDIVDLFFNKTEEIVDDVMEDCSWTKETITDLVLLGGSSKLATIRESITSKLNHVNLSVHHHVNPDEAVAVEAAAVARQAIRLKKESSNRLDRFHLQDKTSYCIGVECDEGTVQIIVDKHTDIPCEGVPILNASRGWDSLLMNIMEGDGKLAYENRLIGTFRMEKGTLHGKGAEFSLNWQIDENFDFHATASDPVIVQEILELGDDPSKAERGVSLHLIGLKDHQIAKHSLTIRTMWNEQHFLVARTSLLSELNLLSASLSTLQINQGKLTHFYIDSSRKWLNDEKIYSETMLEEVQRRLNEFCRFIKLSMLLKKLENCFQKTSSTKNDENDAKKKLGAIFRTFEDLQTQGVVEAQIRSLLTRSSCLEKEIKALESKNKRIRSDDGPDKRSRKAFRRD